MLCTQYVTGVFNKFAHIPNCRIKKMVDDLLWASCYPFFYFFPRQLPILFWSSCFLLYHALQPLSAITYWPLGHSLFMTSPSRCSQTVSLYESGSISYTEDLHFYSGHKQHKWSFTGHKCTSPLTSYSTPVSHHLTNPFSLHLTVTTLVFCLHWTISTNLFYVQPLLDTSHDLPWNIVFSSVVYHPV